MDKKILFGFLFLVFFIAFGAGMKLYDFYKSYDIPRLDQNVSLNNLNLNFEKETELVQNLTEPQQIISLENINIDNLEEAYSLSRNLAKEGNKQDAISYLKEIVKLDPTNLVYINELRILYLEMKKTDLFLEFTQTLTETYEVKLNNALAYVDYLQSPDLGTANLGQKSVQSITILDEMLEENPYDLLARYARGLNNLYWPSGLQRTSKAIDDLTFCVSAEEKFGDQYFEFWPDCFITLGDAYVKDGDIEKGKQVWEKGEHKYPNNEGLKDRSNLSDKEAVKLVTEVRGIDIFQRPDASITNLNVIWE